ncbi:MAG TPA: T9SS type A sorting domain-containing protein [Ignavibacteriaceae bacterium]|nr:T9SS type A sorting domain-containing protein [Ignavibacteriaceae bacterium]
MHKSGLIKVLFSLYGAAMKSYLLLFSLLLVLNLNAQSNLPRAGEFQTNALNKTDLIKAMRPGNFLSKETLDVINFDSSNVSFKGNYPFGSAFGLGMSTSDNLVFVGSGGGIYVTDVTDPQNPLVRSEIRTRSLVDDCTYDPVNKRLYVCAYFSGIEIWDLSDLENPVRMSRIPTEPYPRSGVAYSGNYIFFTTNNNLFSYDVTDPYNPTVANELFITNALILQMYLKGNILYLVADTQGLKLIDVSNPLNLQLIHAYSFIAGTEFDISGNYLYAVKNGTAVFTVLDITDSLNVTLKGTLNLGGYPFDVAVFNNMAYVAKGGTDGGMQVIDVNNPSAPASVSLYPGDFQFIQGSGNYVYLTRNSEFSILDVSDPASVQYVTGYEIPGFIYDVSVSGNYAYTGSNGFRVMDISDSTHPVQVGYADIPGDNVEAAGNSLVVYCPQSMTANNTVHIMDVSDPANPQSIASYTCPVMTGDLVVRDTLAYIACWWDGVRIFNFANPSSLVQTAHTMGWTQGGIAGVDWCYAQAVAVEGNYLYIIDYGPFETDDTYGLYIMDITDPSNPYLINRFQGITSHGVDLSVKNSIVYIADGYGGVEIVNVADPLNPSVIGYVGLPDGATGIKVVDNYAYVSNYILGGVELIDITDPANSYIIGWYKPSGCFAVGIEYNNGFIYAADGVAGFQIYRNLLAVVPVELTSFTAITNEEGVTLNWETSSETNNSGFDIERSTDDIVFKKIGYVKGNGTTSEAHSYSFKDGGVSSVGGIVFYRLKQIDYDGSCKYSEAIKVEDAFLPANFSLSQNYPNPFNPETSIKFGIPKESKVTLKVFNVLGKEIETVVDQKLDQGYYNYKWNGSKFASGVYFYRLEAGNFVQMNKMIMIK